jgi:hypothetical protein
MSTGWNCPQCGDLAVVNVTPYLEGLFNAASHRFDPRCRSCRSRATFDAMRGDAEPTAPVLVISGSCASGKTTVSYLLSEHFGFVQIDGDWALERHRTRICWPKTHPRVLGP